jgi:ribokinase
VILNPAPAVPLPDDIYECVHYLILNESEAEILSSCKLIKNPEHESNNSMPYSLTDLSEIARIFIKKGVLVVIITLGASGAYFKTQFDEEHGTQGVYSPAIKASVVDTTAAGDTFVGACAVSLARGYGVRCVQGPDFDNLQATGAVQFGQCAAAKTVEREGAQASIPFGYEVETE